MMYVSLGQSGGESEPTGIEGARSLIEEGGSCKLDHRQLNFGRGPCARSSRASWFFSVSQVQSLLVSLRLLL